MCPFPTIQGNSRRLVSLLEWLKGRGFSLTYVLQPNEGADSDGIAKLRELVDRLEIVGAAPASRGPAVLLKRICARLAMLLPARIAEGLPTFVSRTRPPAERVEETSGTRDVGDDQHIDRWCWPATCPLVHRVVKRDRPVAVITEYAVLSKCLEGIPGPTLRIIDTVELFFRNQERFQVDGLSAPLVCSPESEKAALNRADVLMAIQSNDAQALKDLFPGKQVVTVPHTYPDGRPRAATPRFGTVLCVGSSNPFNVHGLQQFLKEAWEPILERVPDAMLRVVGAVALSPGTDHRRVTHIGRVSDEELAREYQTAHVVINPQMAGTGLKIKCVEALSASCPVVMNQAGADGLEEGAGTAFLMATDWREFSDHVVRILTDAGVRRELESEARRFAAKMFSAEVTFSELERALNRFRSVGDR